MLDYARALFWQRKMFSVDPDEARMTGELAHIQKALRVGPIILLGLLERRNLGDPDDFCPLMAFQRGSGQQTSAQSSKPRVEQANVLTPTLHNELQRTTR